METPAFFSLQFTAVTKKPAPAVVLVGCTLNKKFEPPFPGRGQTKPNSVRKESKKSTDESRAPRTEPSLHLGRRSQKRFPRGKGLAGCDVPMRGLRIHERCQTRP